MAHAAGVLALGLVVLLLVGAEDPRRLSWTDELVYTSVARNLATGRGNVSSYPHPLAVMASGTTSIPDVHMPGHMFLVAAFLRLLGPSEWAAVLPCQLAFLVSGVLVFVLGRRLFGAPSGSLAAALFFLWPPFASFAHTAMAEMPVVLLGVVFLLAWVEAEETPRMADALVLALLLAAGTLVRETLLAFLPAALWALRRRGPRAGLAFALALVAALAFVVWPLARLRPSYPVLGLQLRLHESLLSALGRGAAANAGVMATWPGCFYLQGALMAALALSFPRLVGWERRLGALALFTYGTLWVVLFPVYPFWDWYAERMLLFATPPALVVVAAALVRVRHPWIRGAAVALVVAVLLGVSVPTVRTLGNDRREWFDKGWEASEALRKLLSEPKPAVVVAPGAYRYGWDAFPVTVIAWTTKPDQLAPLLARVRPDVVVAGPRDQDALAQGESPGPAYCLVSPTPINGRLVFRRSDP